MKVLINDVRGTFEKVITVNSLKELKEILLKYNLSLVEAYDNKRINSLDNDTQAYENQRFKGCELILTEHNDYIE